MSHPPTRVLLIGDRGVGKTALISAFVTKTCGPQALLPQTATPHYSVPIGLGSNNTINLIDGDAALAGRGHRTFQEVDAVVLLLDAQRWALQLPHWRDFLRPELAHARSSSIVVLVALTKIDLAPSAMEVISSLEKIRAAFPLAERVMGVCAPQYRNVAELFAECVACVDAPRAPLFDPISRRMSASCVRALATAFRQTEVRVARKREFAHFSVHKPSVSFGADSTILNVDNPIQSSTLQTDSQMSNSWLNRVTPSFLTRAFQRLRNRNASTTSESQSEQMFTSSGAQIAYSMRRGAKRSVLGDNSAASSWRHWGCLSDQGLSLMQARVFHEQFARGDLEYLRRIVSTDPRSLYHDRMTLYGFLHMTYNLLSAEPLAPASEVWALIHAHYMRRATPAEIAARRREVEDEVRKYPTHVSSPLVRELAASLDVKETSDDINAIMSALPQPEREELLVDSQALGLPAYFDRSTVAGLPLSLRPRLPSNPISAMPSMTASFGQSTPLYELSADAIRFLYDLFYYPIFPIRTYQPKLLLSPADQLTTPSVPVPPVTPTARAVEQPPAVSTPAVSRLSEATEAEVSQLKAALKSHLVEARDRRLLSAPTLGWLLMPLPPHLARAFFAPSLANHVSTFAADARALVQVDEENDNAGVVEAVSFEPSEVEQLLNPMLDFCPPASRRSLELRVSELPALNTRALPVDGWLSLWASLAQSDPQKTYERLVHVGYPCDENQVNSRLFAPPVVVAARTVAKPYKSTVTCLLIGSRTAQTALKATLFGSTDHDQSFPGDSSNDQTTSADGSWVQQGQCTLPWTTHAAELPLDAKLDFNFARTRFVRLLWAPSNVTLATLSTNTDGCLDRLVSALPHCDCVSFLIDDKEAAPDAQLAEEAQACETAAKASMWSRLFGSNIVKLLPRSIAERAVLNLSAALSKPDCKIPIDLPISFVRAQSAAASHQPRASSPSSDDQRRVEMSLTEIISVPNTVAVETEPLVHIAQTALNEALARTFELDITSVHVGSSESQNQSSRFLGAVVDAANQPETHSRGWKTRVNWRRYRSYAARAASAVVAVGAVYVSQLAWSSFRASQKQAAAQREAAAQEAAVERADEATKPTGERSWMQLIGASADVVVGGAREAWGSMKKKFG